MGLLNFKAQSVTDIQTPCDPVTGMYLTTSGANLNGESGESHIPFGRQCCIKTCAAGVNHSLAVLLDGQVVAWGSNRFAQLGCGPGILPVGDDAGAQSQIPKKVEFPSGVNIWKVAAGFGHSAAISELGELFTWGSGNDGQLGFELTVADKPDNCTYRISQIPKSVPGLLCLVEQVACGKNFTIVLGKNESVFSFGSGQHGVLGHGNYVSVSTPTQIEELKEVNVSKIVAGWSHVLAQSVSGSVYTWGNAYADINKNYEDIMVPTQVQELEGINVTDIACGNYHNLALDNTGSVYAWGGNGYGQLGIGQNDDYLVLTPTRANIDTEIAKVFAGGNFSMALGKNDSVFAWGSNKYKQLGPDVPNEVVQPLSRNESHGYVVRDICCGDSHMLILSQQANVGQPSVFAFNEETGVERKQGEQPDKSCAIPPPGQCERLPSWVAHRPNVVAKVIDEDPRELDFKSQ